MKNDKVKKKKKEKKKEKKEEEEEGKKEEEKIRSLKNRWKRKQSIRIVTVPIPALPPCALFRVWEMICWDDYSYEEFKGKGDLISHLFL